MRFYPLLALAQFVFDIILGIMLPIALFLGLVVLAPKIWKDARVEFPDITVLECLLIGVGMCLAPLKQHLYDAPSNSLAVLLNGRQAFV